MLVGDLVYNDALDLECNYLIYENSSQNVLVDTKKNGFHKPLASILDMTSGSHTTKVTCSSVALSDKAKYRRIRL